MKYAYSFLKREKDKKKDFQSRDIYIIYFPLNILCLIYKSFTKRIKKQTTNPLVYVVSCRTTTIMDGQVLKIITMLTSNLPNHLINTVRLHLEWLTKYCLMVLFTL